MSDRKTPEERAKEYASGYGHGTTMPKKMQQGIYEGLAIERHVAFLAGRADFIKNDLPKLLEMARETYETRCGEGDDFSCDEYSYSIAQLLAMAEKGEV